MLSKLEDIQQLSGIAQNDIFALVSGSGVYVTEIPKLCSNIVNVIDRFLDPAASIDLSEPSIQDFLKHTLPALTEAFLRRVTLRYVRPMSSKLSALCLNVLFCIVFRSQGT